MTKEATPTKISEPKEWTNPKFNKTIYYYQIEFDNGDKGEFSTTKAPQVKFQIGVLSKYTVEPKMKDGVVKKDKYGKEEYVIDIFKENTFGGFKKKMTKPYENRSIAASVALECAEQLLNNKQSITPYILKKCADRLYLYLIKDNIIYTEPVEKWEDPNDQLAIQKMTSLRRAASCSKMFSIEKADDLIKLAEELNSYINFKSNM